jgi:hypothetical protein
LRSSGDAEPTSEPAFAAAVPNSSTRGIQLGQSRLAASRRMWPSLLHHFGVLRLCRDETRPSKERGRLHHRRCPAQESNAALKHTGASGTRGCGAVRDVTGDM